MNRIDLDGHVAVVTGGAQGIGHAIAKRCVASGAKVAIWDINKTTRDDAPGFDGVLRIQADIASEDSVAAALEETRRTLGAVSILVNSAGIAGPNHTLETYPPTDWHQVIDINLHGTFYTNRAVVPDMKARGFERIVNFALIAGKEGNPNASAYSASKAGVIALTKSLGKELAGYDIAVNCITPAVARTPIFAQMTQEHIDYMLSKIPRGRFLETEEVAAMVAWLVSKENAFTTGAVFDLSGGRATY